MLLCHAGCSEGQETLGQVLRGPLTAALLGVGLGWCSEEAGTDGRPGKNPGEPQTLPCTLVHAALSSLEAAARGDVAKGYALEPSGPFWFSEQLKPSTLQRLALKTCPKILVWRVWRRLSSASSQNRQEAPAIHSAEFSAPQMQAVESPGLLWSTVLPPASGLSPLQL